jgi:hypothetical protein|tara:strand:+ start:3462 stop:3935 length:474 start_codon:yes stop_codon:yes gene_type:complete
MEINIDRIKSRFDNKITKDEIIKVYWEFKRINDVIKLNRGIEESICKYFKCKLNIQSCSVEIDKLQMEIRGYENDVFLLKRESFDEMRSSRKLMNFLWNLDEEILDMLMLIGCIRSEERSEIKLERFREKRDRHNKDYNNLNLDGNVSVGSNTEVWR